MRRTCLSSTQNLPQTLQIQDARERLFLHDGGGEGGFFFLEGANFFLHSIARDQAVGDDLVFLADPVRAVDRLRFHRGVPPRVEEHDIARGGEIEAGTGGFQREQENGNRGIGLKLVHEVLAVFRLARKHEMRDPAGGELHSDKLEHRDELRENQNLVPLGDERFEGVEQRFELGARRREGVGDFGGGGCRVGGVLLCLQFRRGFTARGFRERTDADEARVAADLAEAEQGLQDVEALGVEVAVVFHSEQERMFTFIISLFGTVGRNEMKIILLQKIFK